MAPLIFANRTKKPTAGMLSIYANSVLQMKLCWKVVGDVTGLVHALRDKFIVAPDDVWLEAELFGFSDMLLLKREGRLTADGNNTEPDKPDPARLHFTDSDMNPLQSGEAITLDMSQEFAAAERKRS